MYDVCTYIQSYHTVDFRHASTIHSVVKLETKVFTWQLWNQTYTQEYTNKITLTYKLMSPKEN